MTISPQDDKDMPRRLADGFATVTFAMYDEAPIACQGDDDHKKIQVVRQQLKMSGDLHHDALQASLELGRLHGLPVQVWDVRSDETAL